MVRVRYPSRWILVGLVSSQLNASPQTGVPSGASPVTTMWLRIRSGLILRPMDATFEPSPTRNVNWGLEVAGSVKGTICSTPSASKYRS